MKSVIYWNPILYRLIMRMIYGKDFQKKYSIVSKEIGLFSVLDVCCGDCFLANYVACEKYRGIDINPAFVEYGRKKGLPVSCMNVVKDNWPLTECVVILSSLYQFIPYHEEILKKAFKSAKKRIIVSEPIYNLADSKNRFIAYCARRFTDPGTESSKQRFNRDSLVILYKKYNVSRIIDGGRELIGVFDVDRIGGDFEISN